MFVRFLLLSISSLFPKAQQQFPGMQPSAAPSLRNTPQTEDPKFSSEDFDRYFGENNVAPGLYDKNKGNIIFNKNVFLT